MTIGTITVDLLARTGSFETDFDRAGKLAAKRAKEIDAAVSKAGTAIGVALGAAGAAALAMGKNIIDGLDALNDVKDATGASIANISALEDVALHTGTSMDTVSGAIVKFNNTLKEADGKNGASMALKAIGLSAEELKRLDPAEALRQTAVALSGFADDGNKARLVQELFGKSVKEVAPFLNDLAEKTQLVGKVTDEQAASAERFNKQLFDMKAASVEAGRALISELLPSLIRITQEINEGRKAFGSYFNAFVEIGMKTNPFDGWGDNAKKANLEVQNLTAEIDRLQKGGRLMAQNAGGAAFVGPSGGDSSKSRLAAAQRELESATKRKSYFDALIAKSVTPEAERLEAAYYGGNKPTVGDVPKTPKAGKADNSAAQEAKAQLAQDLEDMKKSTALLAGTFDSDEKILSAKRSASLLSDADYYQKKRDIIIATGEVEDAGLQATIKRLKEEQATLSGKDAIDNQRKLNDAQAELQKSRAETAVKLTVLNIESTDSAKKLTQAMVDAETAAQSMLDTTNRARALELAGLGQGTKARDFSGAISQIEQTYEQKRQDLERDRRNGKFKDREDDYKKELDLINQFQKKSIDSYTDYYAQLQLRQQSFTAGASEAARNYFDESQNAFKQTEDAVTRAFGGMEDALANFAKTGKLDVKSLVDSIISDFARIAIKQQITGPLAGLLSGALGAGGSSSLVSGGGDALGAFIQLNGYADGGSPPVGKVSIVGERGPELFVPNTAGKIIPNHALGGGGGGDTYNYDFTVGDVATASMVRNAVANSERRTAGAIKRNQGYGGSLA